MQATDLRLFRAAVLPTAALGLVAIVISLIVSGVPGMLGSLIGLVLVMVFFAVGLVGVAYASRVSPTVMMAAAMGTFLAKIAILIIVLESVRGVTAWSPRAFSLTVILGTIAWTIGEARAFMKLRILYVDPEPSRSVGERAKDERV
ncbi:hypothetical protein HTZ77_35120 [Nonomuraea sp. SMC257]|uniref:ATP synthase subunit I n=1 Tax=Nonomuraea montanisoli TaxID=2741721 RepID=A0A7Y6M6M4_9ACTN|nr:hypothetical protein [Nonomuraea montanisoli]NUW36602.1 hypothetical protein [Nonomuraea montanisoli]